MSEKLFTGGALRAEPAKLYPSVRESDSLDMRLNEKNNFINSIQNIKMFKNFIIMKLKNMRRNLKNI